MRKIIQSFESKKKVLSLEKEKELLRIVDEAIKKIKSISPDALKITQLENEIQQSKKLPNKSLEKKEKELKKLKNKDVYQTCQELIEQFDPQQIEKREQRKPNQNEQKQWKEVQENNQKIRNAVRLILDYNTSFIKYIERGYYYSERIDSEDLTTEGILSLLKAVEKFDPSYDRRLSTYSGHGVRQRINTFIKKNQLISQSKAETKLIYYDSSHQSDKENNSYSLIETLDDGETSNLDAEKVRQQDIKRQFSDLLNSLESRETNLVFRLFYRVFPTNWLDIYYLVTKDEKIELEKKMKLGSKNKSKSLQNLPQQKKISQTEIFKKYEKFFEDCKYLKSELEIAEKIADFLDLSKEKVIRLKSSSFKQLKKLAQERNLHLLINWT